MGEGAKSWQLDEDRARWHGIVEQMPHWETYGGFAALKDLPETLD